MRIRRELLAVTLALSMVAIPPASSASADELQEAMDRADTVAFFLRLGLETEQARWMIDPLARIQDLVEQYRENEQKRLQAMESMLRAARQTLIEGEPLDDRTATELDAYRSGRERAQLALFRSVDAEMRVIAEIFYPQQNALVDWTPPEAVRPAVDVEERLELQRIAFGRMHELATMLDRIKYLDAFNFVTGRIPLINDYLARFYDPNTVEFAEAVEISVQYTDEIRMLGEAEWEENAFNIAADMLEDLGLMPTLEPVRFPGTVGWQSLYRLFTNPQTLDIVRQWALQ